MKLAFITHMTLRGETKCGSGALVTDSEPFPANGAVSEVSEYSGVNGSCYHAAAIVPISVPLFYNGRGAVGRHTT